MAAGLGDLIQIIDNQTYLGETLMNVYYYRVTSITGLVSNYLEVLADWFVAEVMAPVRAIQGTNLTHTLLSVRNLSNNIDYYEDNVNLTGGKVVDLAGSFPSYVTVNFKLIRESLVTRNGSKRFSGLQEVASLGNSYLFATGEKEAIETALAEDIILGVVTVAEPVIVKRPFEPPVGVSYLYSSIGSAAYTKFGTQNTRKP